MLRHFTLSPACLYVTTDIITLVIGTYLPESVFSYKNIGVKLSKKRSLHATQLSVFTIVGAFSKEERECSVQPLK